MYLNQSIINKNVKDKPFKLFNKCMKKQPLLLSSNLKPNSLSASNSFPGKDKVLEGKFILIIFKVNNQYANGLCSVYLNVRYYNFLNIYFFILWTILKDYIDDNKDLLLDVFSYIRNRYN